MQSSDRTTLSSIRAAAYDLVINGAEIGGGSIRIHDRNLQSKNFEILGFRKKKRKNNSAFY